MVTCIVSVLSIWAVPIVWSCKLNNKLCLGDICDSVQDLVFCFVSVWMKYIQLSLLNNIDGSILQNNEPSEQAARCWQTSLNSNVCLALLALHCLSEWGPQCSCLISLDLELLDHHWETGVSVKQLVWVKTIIMCLLPSAERGSRRKKSENIYWAHWNTMYFAVWHMSWPFVLWIKHDKEQTETIGL